MANISRSNVIVESKNLDPLGHPELVSGSSVAAKDAETSSA